MNCSRLESEEVRFVSVFKMVLPSSTKVRGVMISGGSDERESMSP